MSLAFAENFSLSCVSTDSFDQCRDPVGHLRYMRKLSSKPYRVIENDYLMAQHGHAIVRRKEGTSRDNVDELDAFLLQDIAEVPVRDSNSNTINVHRIFVASNRGGDYCQVGWVLKEEASCCMRCATPTPDVSTDRHSCTACGNVVCSSCSKNTAVIVELQTMEKFTVCSDCFQGEHEEIEAVKNERFSKEESVGRPLSGGASNELNNLAAQLASVANIQSVGSSDSHLAFIRSMAKKPVLEVRKAYDMAKDGRALVQRRSSFSFSRAAVEAYVISRMTVEPLDTSKSATGSATPSGTKRGKYYRVYVTSIGGGEYCKVGWVLQDSTSHCLRCLNSFGLLSSKHNCVGCGDVICSRCSPCKVVISELRSDEPHRVCNACYDPKAGTDKGVSIRARWGRSSEEIDLQLTTNRSAAPTPLKKEVLARTVSEEAMLDEQLTQHSHSSSHLALSALLQSPGPTETVDFVRPPLPPKSPTPAITRETVAENHRVFMASQVSINDIPMVDEIGGDESDSESKSDSGSSSDEELGGDAVEPTARRLSLEAAGMAPLEVTIPAGDGEVQSPNSGFPIDKEETHLQSLSSSSHTLISRTESDLGLLVPSTPTHNRSFANSKTVSFTDASHLCNAPTDSLPPIDDQDAVASSSEGALAEAASEKSVLTLTSEELDKEGLLSSDGSTAVIPIARLTEEEQATLAKRGFLPDGSTHAFIPVFKLHLRHVETAAKKETKKFELPQVKLQHVSAEAREKRKVLDRRPSAASMVQLRPVKSTDKMV